MPVNLYILPLSLDFQIKPLEKRYRLYGVYSWLCFANCGKRKKVLASVCMSPASENCSSGRGHLSRRETLENKSIPKGQTIDSEVRQRAMAIPAWCPRVNYYQSLWELNDVSGMAWLDWINWWVKSLIPVDSIYHSLFPTLQPVFAEHILCVRCSTGCLRERKRKQTKSLGSCSHET